MLQRRKTFCQELLKLKLKYINLYGSITHSQRTRARRRHHERKKRRRGGGHATRTENQRRKGTGFLRIGQMNLRNLTRAKFEQLLRILEDTATDVFVGSETHLDRPSPTRTHCLSRNRDWSVFRADLECIEDGPSDTSQRGGVMVMIRKTLAIESTKLTPSHGMMSSLSLSLKRKEWDRHFRLTAIYRSPNSEAEEMPQQFSKIGDLLTATECTSKPSVNIVAGDLNAHTGAFSEGAHINGIRPLPPPRWGDPHPNHQPRRGAASSAGDLLLDTLEETRGIIITNRFRSSGRQRRDCKNRFWTTS